MEYAIAVQDLYKAFWRSEGGSGASASASRTARSSACWVRTGRARRTTISMLSCLLRPTQRRCAGDGPFAAQRRAWRSKSVLGVVPQDIALYEDLSARENLTFWGKMYGLRGAALQAARGRGAGDDRPDRPCRRTGSGKYSGGMKRRVNIGVALLHKPKVIYMDEPTVGIDPQSRGAASSMAWSALKDQGMTVLYTTHYMEEAAGALRPHRHHGPRQDDRLRHARRAGQDRWRACTALHLTVNAESDGVLEAWKSRTGVSQVSVEDGSFTILADGQQPGAAALCLKLLWRRTCAPPQWRYRSLTWRRCSCTYHRKGFA
ncbi:MAG: ATP-binding cassette domain-containing protein [Desulfobacterales bacterium]|nr:ATP-binding cassette domain-containing protein [Desulfobacterales bacterium]